MSISATNPSQGFIEYAWPHGLSVLTRPCLRRRTIDGCPG